MGLHRATNYDIMKTQIDFEANRSKSGTTVLIEVVLNVIFLVPIELCSMTLSFQDSYLKVKLTKNNISIKYTLKTDVE